MVLRFLWKPLKYCGSPGNLTRNFLNKVKTIQHTAKGMNGNFKEDNERISAHR